MSLNDRLVRGNPAVSFIISAVFITLTFTVPDSVGFSSSYRNILISVLSGISASFLFITALDTINSLRRFVSLRGAIRIFGEDALSDNIFLVYPEFVLSEEAKTVLNNFDKSSIYDKVNYYFPPDTYSFNIPKTVSENDIKAAVIMSSALANISPQNVRIISDTDAVEYPDRSFISFGLRSNSLTWKYFEQETDPLFKIESSTGGDLNDDRMVITRDNKRIEFQSTDKTQYVIILKVRPKIHPKRTWILCSGLGAIATPAAAWYLAKNWRDLERRAKDGDFLVVLKVPSYSFRAAEEVEFIVRDKSRFMRRLMNQLGDNWHGVK